MTVRFHPKEEPLIVISRLGKVRIFYQIAALQIHITSTVAYTSSATVVQ